MNILRNFIPIIMTLFLCMNPIFSQTKDPDTDPGGSTAELSDLNFGEKPTMAKGFNQNLFSIEGLDNINLFNGNLSLTIPIGPTYRVGPKIRYQLTMSYNSKIWRKVDKPIIGQCIDDWDPTQPWDPDNSNPDPGTEPCAQGNKCDVAATAVMLEGDPTNGLGWKLHLGRQIQTTLEKSEPDERYQYFIETPDGSRHRLYQTTDEHKGNDESKDNSYIFQDFFGDGLAYSYDTLAGVAYWDGPGDGSVQGPAGAG